MDDRTGPGGGVCKPVRARARAGYNADGTKKRAAQFKQVVVERCLF